MMKYPLLQHSVGERSRLIYHPTTGSAPPYLISYHRKEGLISKKCVCFWLLSFSVVCILMGLASWTDILPCHEQKDESTDSTNQILDDLSGTNLNAKNQASELRMADCQVPPCYRKAKIHVPLDNPSFPSFLNYAHRGPLHVTYDRRSLRLNDQRVFFLGGSMHPARATKETWNMALDEAVHNGLNLITIYVMWSEHQPFPDRNIDWSFPQSVSCYSIDYPTQSCDWNLATALRAAANRGFFVHLRIGP